MKKVLAILLVLCMCMGLCACGAKEDPCDHQYEEAITQEATCASLGVKTFTCTLCNDSYTEDIPLTDHNYGDWIVVSKPSFSTIGQERSSCAVCGNQQFRDIPMLEPQTVKLTKDNFMQYFSIDCRVTDYKKETGTIFYYGYTTVTVKCSLKADAELNNVTVKLSLAPHGGLWEGKTYDPINMSIPTRIGYAEEEQELTIISTSISKIAKPDNVTFNILEVSGTIVVYS